MKKVLTAAVVTSLMAGSAMAGADLGIDFANAHIFRGATASDEFVIQPTAELAGFGMPEEYGEFVLGAWGSMAPFADNTGQDTFYETDWYLTYMLPKLAEDLDLYVGLTQYTYTGDNNNEAELNLGAGYLLADAFYFAASFNYIYYNQGAGNATDGQVYIPLSFDWSTEISEGFEGSAGALISFMMQGDGNGSGANALDDGFNHYEIYGALDYALGEMWSIGGSLAYIGQGDSKVLSDNAYDVSVLGMISLSCEL